MEHRIFSPGKLLLTSEYVVLDGALSLAIPTKWGQEFFFEEISDEQSIVYWTAFHQNELWLTIKIDYRKWNILETNRKEAAEFILQILKNIQELSAITFQEKKSYRLKTNLQFPSDYGLGSSSTLMNNLAEWAGIDAFVLNENNLGGSGYDIAVAQKKSPILYRHEGISREIELVAFDPEFKKDLIFIHLNQKQNSREGIQLYKSKEKSPALIAEFSDLTQKVVAAPTLAEFSELMEVHEEELSGFLGLETVKEKHFADCPVFVKSLGAWGGDFVLSSKFSGFEGYFREKGFSAIFCYEDLII